MRRAALLTASAVVLLSGCGLVGGTSGSSSQQSAAQPARTTQQAMQGGTIAQAKAAIGSALKKYDGEAVNLRNVQGDHWLVTVYSGNRVRDVTVTQDGTKATKSGPFGAPRSGDAAQWEGVKISLQQAIVNAEHRQAGRVLSARITDKGGELHFEVRIIPPNNGAAVTVKLTSRSGDVIGS